MNRNFDYCFIVRLTYYMTKVFEGFRKPAMETQAMPEKGTQIELAIKERCLN